MTIFNKEISIQVNNGHLKRDIVTLEMYMKHLKNLILNICILYFHNKVPIFQKEKFLVSPIKVHSRSKREDNNFNNILMRFSQEKIS
jgi:hypothetical protein